MDFSCKKGASCEFKILFLKKVLKDLSINEPLVTLDPDTSSITQDKNDKLLDEYRIVFTDRNKKTKIGFNDNYLATQLVVKMFKNIFGSDIITQKKTTKNTKTVRIYKLDAGIVQFSKTLYDEGFKAVNENHLTGGKSRLYSKVKY